MTEIRKRDYSRKSTKQLEALLKKKMKDIRIKQFLEELSKKPKNTLRDIINRETSKNKPQPKKIKVNYIGSNRDIVKKFKETSKKKNKLKPKKNKMDIKYIIN